jgi:hypothetical protein
MRIPDLQHLNAVLYKDLIHEIEFRICLHPLRHFNCGPPQMRQILCFCHVTSRIPMVMRFGKAHIRPRCHRGVGSKNDATGRFDESRDYADEQDRVKNEKDC